MVKSEVREPKFTFTECCDEVIEAFHRKEGGALMAYAATYAEAAIERSMHLSTAHKRAQVPYILTNLGGWKGERAREVKASLVYHGKERI